MLHVSLIVFLLPLAYSPGPGNMFFAAVGAQSGFGGSLPASAGYHLATFVVTALTGMGFEAAARGRRPKRSACLVLGVQSTCCGSLASP